MKFFHNLLNNHSGSDVFNKIQGYDDVKVIINRALDAEDNYNLLFIGPPASSKTLFLQGILQIRKDAHYFDGSNTTSRILDVLAHRRLLQDLNINTLIILLDGLTLWYFQKLRPPYVVVNIEISYPTLQYCKNYTILCNLVVDAN